MFKIHCLSKFVSLYRSYLRFCAFIFPFFKIDDSIPSSWTAKVQDEAIRILCKDPNVPRNRCYYHVLKAFSLVELGGVRRVCKKRDGKMMATTESFDSIIQDTHIAINHKGETKTHKKIQDHYFNIPKMAVRSVISKCERCAEKSKRKCAQEIVVRPILVSFLNDRGQVDLVNYQSLPDGEFRYIMHYKERLTKYASFRPLTCKQAVEVARRDNFSKLGSSSGTTIRQWK